MCLNQRFWHNRNLRQDLIGRRCKTVIRPVLTYYVETRNETIKTRQQSGVTNKEVLKRVARKKKRDRESKENVRQTFRDDNAGDLITRKACSRTNISIE